MAVVNVQSIAHDALGAMQAGGDKDQHYDVALFAQTFPRVVRNRGHTQLMATDYLRILWAMMQQCCQHGEDTACNLCCCSYHVREHLEAEWQRVTEWLSEGVP